MSVQQGPLDLSLLSDGICIITGAANGGIGFGIATRAMEIGMDILILDLRADVCENAANELRSKNTSNNNNIIIGLACDVSIYIYILYSSKKLYIYIYNTSSLTHH